jgi:hypothetical protein
MSSMFFKFFRYTLVGAKRLRFLVVPAINVVFMIIYVSNPLINIIEFYVILGFHILDFFPCILIQGDNKIYSIFNGTL